jgi:hypothetical protein
MPLYVKTGKAEQDAARIRELDAAPTESLSLEEQKKRADRERKRAERKAAKDAEAKKEAAQRAEEACETAEEFWHTQRAKWTQEERAKLEAIHAEMVEWVAVLQDYINGTDQTTEQDLADTVADVKALIQEHGECDTGFLCVDRFWADPIFKSVISRAKSVPKFRADEIFARFGYFTALPSFVLEPFRAKFMTKRGSTEKPYASIKCGDCGFANVVPWEIFHHYQGSKYTYPCEWCKAVNAKMPERKSLTTEEIHERIEKHRASKNKSGPEDEIFDQYGRIDFYK